MGPSESGVHIGETGDRNMSTLLLGMGFLGIDKFLGFSIFRGVCLSAIVVLIHYNTKVKKLAVQT